MATSKKILFITGDISPTSAQGVRYANLAKEWVKHSDITHLTFNAKKFSIPETKNYDILPQLDVYSYTVIVRAVKFVLNNLLFPDRFIIFKHLYLRKIKFLFKETTFDNVIIGMTPFSFFELGAFVKKLDKNTFLSADLSDPFSANAQHYNNTTAINRAKQYEVKFMKSFDSLVVLNDSINKYYRQLGHPNVLTIEQGVSDIFYKHINSRKPPLKNRLKLIYAGGFYRDFRDPTTLIQTIFKHNLPVDLLIYGGSRRDKYHLKNYKFIQRFKHISQNDLVDKFLESNVLLLIDNFYGIQVPGKTIECLSFNRPVLLIYNNENSPSLAYARNVSGGIYLAKNNTTDILLAINNIMDSYDMFEKRFDHTPFIWRNLALKYKSAINL